MRVELSLKSGLVVLAAIILRRGTFFHWRTSFESEVLAGEIRVAKSTSRISIGAAGGKAERDGRGANCSIVRADGGTSLDALLTNRDGNSGMDSISESAMAERITGRAGVDAFKEIS